jgi:SAM-dependent methyltransferase
MRYGFAELEERYARLAEVGRAVDWKGGSFEEFDLRSFLEKILPMLHFPAPRPRAMEYGTGTGPGACFLAARGFRVEAIDISPTAIQLARRFATERGLEISFEVADICDLPCGDRRYDLVVDNYCLQRIASDGRREQALQTVRCLLAVGGHFLIGTVLAREGRDYGEDRFDARTGIRYRRLGEDAEKYEDAVRIERAWYVPIRRYLRAEELRAELEGAGFEVVRQRGGQVLCVVRRRAA